MGSAEEEYQQRRARQPWLLSLLTTRREPVREEPRRWPKRACGPRLIAAEVKQHSGEGTGFWAVIDSFVVDCSEFVDTHPGGLRKLLSADSPATGATGQPFGFSFSRGRNAHFPDTGKRFREGVKRYLSGGGGDPPFLPPTDVAFPPSVKL